MKCSATEQSERREEGEREKGEGGEGTKQKLHNLAKTLLFLEEAFFFLLRVAICMSVKLP